MNLALVVGGGSIATRHARLLGLRGLEVSLVTSQTATETRAFASVAQALSTFTPDYVVVANETSHHSSAVSQLSDAGFSGRLLIEKPAAVSSAAGVSFSSVGVGFNLRFHPVVTRLREIVNDEIGRENIIQVDAYAGQWLPDWRPDRPVASQYSAHASRGGGVLRDLSHELDLLQWIVGPVTGVFARGGRHGSLTVDSDDAWSIILAQGAATTSGLQLNYFDRPGCRILRVVGAEMTVTADIGASTLNRNGQIEHFTVDRDETYRAMHDDMLAHATTVATLAEAEETDLVIADIERSAREVRWVER